MTAPECRPYLRRKRRHHYQYPRNRGNHWTQPLTRRLSTSPDDDQDRVQTRDRGLTGSFLWTGRGYELPRARNFEYRLPEASEPCRRAHPPGGRRSCTGLVQAWCSSLPEGRVSAGGRESIPGVRLLQPQQAVRANISPQCRGDPSSFARFTPWWRLWCCWPPSGRAHGPPNWWPFPT